MHTYKKLRRLDYVNLAVIITSHKLLPLVVKKNTLKKRPKSET